MINYIIIAIVIAYIEYATMNFKQTSFLVYRFLLKNGVYNGWRIPLISCELCLTWWVTILYTLIIGISFEGILLSAISSYASKFIRLLFIIIEDKINALINMI